MGSKVDTIKPSSILALQSSLVDTVAQAKKSVVSIAVSKDVKFYAEDPSQLNGPGTVQQQTANLGGWSGIIISKQWYILTNKHVVQDTAAKYSVTLYDGTVYNVDKIWFDDLLDLAVLKIVDEEGKSLTDMDSVALLSFQTPIEIGQFALAIGNSLSIYSHNVTFGIIWGKNKQLTINKNNLYVWLYQTDARVYPGNSWGPLLDIEGHVLGITTAISQEGMTFALPISKEFVESTIKSIESFGKIARPIIGIQYIDITPAIKKENKNISLNNGIYIKDVLADLPAWEAGLKIDDIVVGIHGQAISNQLPFLYQLYTYIPGDTITLDVIRGWKELTISVLLVGNTQ